MAKQKPPAPVSDLFDQGYKLSYFCESLSKYDENHLKERIKYLNHLKKLETS